MSALWNLGRPKRLKLFFFFSFKRLYSFKETGETKDFCTWEGSVRSCSVSGEAEQVVQVPQKPWKQEPVMFLLLDGCLVT